MAKNLRINVSINTKGAVNATNKLKKSLRGLGNLIRSSFAAVVRTGVVAGFFLALRNGIRTVRNFKRALVDLGKQFAELRLKAAETAGIITGGSLDFGSVFQEAITMSREMSNQIGRSAIEIQEGMVTAARAGLGLADSVRVTGSAMQLAVSNGADFQNTLNDLIASTRAFGVELSEVPQFAEALTQAVRSSLTSLQGLFAGLKRVGAIAATAFGEGEETFLDTAAALQVLNDAGVQGEKAGTRMRSFMTKLVSQTGKVSAAMAKYNVNIFESNSASDKYMDTLIRGSRAMEDTKQKLAALKDEQFRLTIANKQGSKEYEEISESIDTVSEKLSVLQSGTDEVINEFRLAGGKLKPFNSLLNDMARNIPSEVIAKVFGIRGGQAGTILTNNIEKFNKFRTALEEVAEASKEGKSILGDIFANFLETVQIRFMRIKNTALNIFGEIASGFFDAMGPLLEPIQMALDSVFNTISNNKDLFKKVFQGAADELAPIINKVAVFFAGMSDQMLKVFTPFAPITVGEFRATDEGLKQVDTKKVSGSAGDKFKALFKSLTQLIIEGLKAGLRGLSEEISFLAQLFAEGFTTIIQGKVALFESIGSKMGAAIAGGFFKALMREWPTVVRMFGNALDAMGIPKSVKVGGVKVPGTPFKLGGKEIPLRANPESIRQGISNMMNPWEGGGGVVPTSEAKKRSIDMNRLGEGIKSGINAGINLGALNTGSNQLEMMSVKSEKAAQLFQQTATKANARATRALERANQANRASYKEKQKLR